MRIFLDANILFSAAKSSGAMRDLLSRARAAGHVLCADAYVAAEARRNMEVTAAADLPALDALLAGVEVAAYRPHSLRPETAALLPDKDRPVLAAAIGCRCDVLATGDRTRFGAFYGRVIEGVAIHSPRSLAEALDLTIGGAKRPR